MNMEKIYAKTEKALKEFEQGNRTLSLRHRQMLIMVDGVRSTSALLKLFNKADVAQLLADLEKLGYLVDKNASAITAGRINSDVSADPLESVTGEQLDFIKGYLVDNLRQYAGILGRELEQKINFAQTGRHLKALIPSWHMTIRGSKIGVAASDKLMETLYHLVANLPSASASALAS